MLFAVILMVVVVLAVPAFLVMALRGWGTQEEQVEKRLRSPESHKVGYLVPEGEDPAVLRGALARAGFVSAMGAGGEEVLLVECEASERNRVRTILEQAERSGQVRFEDERA